MPSRLPFLLFTTTLLTLLALPGLFHLRYATRGSDLRRWSAFLHTQAPAEAMQSINNDLEHRFLLRFVASVLTSSVPAVHSRLNQDVQVGTDGWLFAAEDTQVCTAAGFLHPSFPRPQQAARQIILFNDYLKSRGIHLLVVPVPAKATIYPDRLDPHYNARGPFLNVDHDRWFAYLRSHGVDAFDLTSTLWTHRDDPAGVLFYPADTHWTDRAKQLAADAIAVHLAPLLAQLHLPPATPYHTRTTTQRDPGNLFEIGSESTPHTYVEQVTQLYYDDGNDSSPSSFSPVLLLGDSQAANFTDSGSGLPQHLTQSLHTDVSSLALAGAGPDEMRSALLSRPDLLPKTRLVIWAFSIRHLLIKPWDPLPLPNP